MEYPEEFLLELGHEMGVAIDHTECFEWTVKDSWGVQKYVGGSFT